MNTFTSDARFQQQLLAGNAALPGILLVADACQGKLGVNPIEYVTRTTGVLALLFIALTLLITPLRKASGWHWLARHRRALGLFAAFYALAHLLTYLVFDRNLQLSTVPADVWKRPFIAIGMFAFCLMVPLAVTSTNRMVKRLGSLRWTRLHRLVYVIAVAGVVHYWMIVKSDVTYPAIFGLAVAILLASRLALAKPTPLPARP